MTVARLTAALPKVVVTLLAAIVVISATGEEPASQVRRVRQLSADELSAIRERALKGDADAQATLGLAYHAGTQTLKSDATQARHWYEMAAKQGNLNAQFWLVGLDHRDQRNTRSAYRQLAVAGHVGGMNAYASLCAEGNDGPQDFAEAMLWWKKAAHAGSAEAAFNVGVMYLEGEGVAADEREGVVWLRRAVDGGSVPAAARLASMAVMSKAGLAPGTDCSRWLNIAAEGGDSTAMFNLGMVLFHGTGAQPDLVEAYMWFTLAAQQGAIDGRTGLRPKMTKAQIAEAERRVTAWKAQHNWR